MDNLKWRATYRNGDVVTKGTYEDIDRDNLAAFQILRGDSVVFSMPFSEGQGKRLVWRRRIEKSPGKLDKVVHVVGKRGGFVAAVFEDGSTLVDDKFREGNEWLYPPEYREYEAI